ncbi:MAG: hypothetical protein JWR84_1361 [Caulobacter sp.]|nr:hypothetical protein [Caulobacter sp.]
MRLPTPQFIAAGAFTVLLVIAGDAAAGRKVDSKDFGKGCYMFCMDGSWGVDNETGYWRCSSGTVEKSKECRLVAGDTGLTAQKRDLGMSVRVTEPPSPKTEAAAPPAAARKPN